MERIVVEGECWKHVRGGDAFAPRSGNAPSAGRSRVAAPPQRIQPPQVRPKRCVARPRPPCSPHSAQAHPCPTPRSPSTHPTSSGSSYSAKRVPSTPPSGGRPHPLRPSPISPSLVPPARSLPTISPLSSLACPLPSLSPCSPASPSIPPSRPPSHTRSSKLSSKTAPADHFRSISPIIPPGLIPLISSALSLSTTPTLFSIPVSFTLDHLLTCHGRSRRHCLESIDPNVPEQPGADITPKRVSFHSGLIGNIFLSSCPGKKGVHATALQARIN